MPSQLVAYSGFSATNYAQEAFSPDLDFGTGELAVSAHVDVPVVIPVSSFPVIGADLITNGGFTSDLSGWTYNAAAWSWSGGVAVKVNAAQVAAILQGACVVGKSYRVTYTVSGYSTGTHYGQAGGVTSAGATGDGTFVVLITATSTGGFGFTSNQGAVLNLDNVSVVEIGPSILADRSAAAGPSFNLGLTAAGKLTATIFDGTTTRTVTTDAAYNNGTWLKASAHYVAGKLSIDVAGKEVKSVTGAPLLTMNNANAVLTIGNSRALDAPWPGSIALLKIGATVPTPEQSVWMYEQEKQMFRADAQICLPASTAVLDLTYDESQDKWMALQAGFESSFTGLVRTATAAPSAGSFSKVDAKGGVKLLARTTTSPGVDVVIPAMGLKEELVRRAEAAAKQSKTLTVFDFDAVAAQTDFVLPMGWTATEVLNNGASQREGATKSFIRLFDGFRETIRFAVAPGAAVWVQITARKE